MSVIPIRAFKDNYIWALPENHAAAWVVDPGEALPVIQYFTQHQLELAGILLTHHHADHSGGIMELLQRWPDVPVYGSHLSRIETISNRVKEGDHLTCGRFELEVMEIPGHTLDHLAFYNSEVLFCGDTLFSAGCGRVFEGTFPQMYNSLTKLRQLPESVKIFCGHEYTLQNLLFAQHVEPANAFIQQKIAEVRALLAQDQPSLPSVLADEKKMNPFLRCEEMDVIKATQQRAGLIDNHPAAIFQVLREWKNNL